MKKGKVYNVEAGVMRQYKKKEGGGEGAGGGNR